jgi:predicted GIY-YIG superfamily endonuclease
MKSFIYVYILQTEVNPDRFYIGLTDDLLNRFAKHNAGRVLHTAKWRPWRLKLMLHLAIVPVRRTLNAT